MPTRARRARSKPAKAARKARPAATASRTSRRPQPRAAASKPSRSQRIAERLQSRQAPEIVYKPVFSKSELNVFRKLLLVQKVSLMGGIQQIAKEASKSQRDAAGDLSTYTYHMADVASDTYDREFSMNIASTEQKALYQIDEALKRIDEGTYGRCLDCAKPIPRTRLKAVPQAALCITCQRQREDKRNT